MRRCMHVELFAIYGRVRVRVFYSFSNAFLQSYTIFYTIYYKASHIPAPVTISYASSLKTSLPIKREPKRFKKSTFQWEISAKWQYEQSVFQPLERAFFVPNRMRFHYILERSKTKFKTTISASLRKSYNSVLCKHMPRTERSVVCQI